jgi:hypothetical protein
VCSYLPSVADASHVTGPGRRDSGGNGRGPGRYSRPDSPSRGNTQPQGQDEPPRPPGAADRGTAGEGQRDRDGHHRERRREPSWGSHTRETCPGAPGLRGVWY